MTIKDARNDFLKHKVFLEHNRILIWLSILLAIAFFFVVRGSSWPLIVDTKLLRFLLYTKAEADHTLYNIGISYVAAYIFYMLQVYLPAKIKTKTAISNTRLDMLNCLRQCAYFIKGWEDYAKVDNENGILLGMNVATKYYEDLDGHISQMTLDELNLIIFRMQEDYDKIKDSLDFKNADVELIKLFSYMDFPDKANDLYQVLISAEHLAQTPGSTLLEPYPQASILEFKLRVMKLARIYDVEDKIVINDATDIEKIEHYRKIIEGSHETVEKNMDYFRKLSPQYGKSIRDNNS